MLTFMPSEKIYSRQSQITHMENQGCQSLFQKKSPKGTFYETVMGDATLTITKQTEATEENADMYHRIKLKLLYDKTRIQGTECLREEDTCRPCNQ